MTIDHTNCVQRDPNVTIEGNGIGEPRHTSIA